MDKAKLRKIIELVESWRVETRWILLGIAVSALLVYLNTLGNGFVFDDWQQIVDNPFLRRADGLTKIFTTGVWQFLGQVGVSNFYRPLMHAMFYGGFHAFGLNPAGYHAVSIALHAAVSLMVYLLVFGLSGDKLTSALAGVLFAVHPVHTEAVAWISAYPELLCALFSLLAMWLYVSVRGATVRERFPGAQDLGKRSLTVAPRTERARTEFLLLAATGPLLFLALLAKEIAVAVPVLLVAYELLRPRAEPDAAGSAAGRPPLATLLLPYASMALAVAAYLAMRINALGALLPAETRRLPLGENIWTAFAVFWRYLQVQLLPVRLHAFYYMKPNTTVLDPVVLAGIALSAALLAALWWLRRKKRPEAWAVPLYVLPLAPALLIPYASVGLLMAERYVYLSSAAFCWAAGAGLAAAIRWAARQRTSPWKAAAACGAVVLLAGAYSVRTAARNTDWRDEIAFYRQTIAESPAFPRAYLNLGEALMRRDRLAEAREVTETAVRLDSSYPDPHMNLGLICRLEGDLGCAETHLRRAVLLGREQNNRFVVSRALTNLAVTYRAAGRLPESVAASEEALAVDPLFAGAHNNLAFALLSDNRPDDAIPHLERALELDPTLDVAWSNMGLAYSMKGDVAKSLELLRRAEHMNPGNAETHARAAEVLLGLGRVQDAIQELTLALQIDPENARARSLHPPQPR